MSRSGRCPRRTVNLRALLPYPRGAEEVIGRADTLQTLDAIHRASALSVRDKLITFCC